MSNEQVVDFISGKKVQATPEELDAVQPFLKVLVEDYGYPKENIMAHPQYRVKVRPSDAKKEYPVDIAVFTDAKCSEDDLLIIVECKKKTRMDGRSQLEDYLRFSKAILGVWFNGDERFYLRKIEHNGRVEFCEIPNIPMYGQRLEDIGMFRRSDLKPTHNLKPVFKAIRNHLAANAVGTTRDETLAQQLINLIFCKIYDERFTEPNSIVTFRAGVNEDAANVRDRILQLFSQVKRKYKEVLDSSDEITLDKDSIVYVVGEMQNYCLIDAERDTIADAFETFIGHALKGGQGQFFTPRNVIQMMVEMLDPSDEDYIIDPSCGSGGFLVETLKYIWTKLDDEAKQYDWSDANLREEKMEVALNKICGIDKDYFLSKVAKAYMAILGDGKSGIFCEDSLENPNNWHAKTRIKIGLNKFSLLLTNPPFGSKIPVRGEDKLGQYTLAKKWTKQKNGEWKIGKLDEKKTPQVLFIERDVALLADYGQMAIVLPDGVFGNATFSYIRKWLMDQGRILAVVDIPAETFQPNTSTKTSVLVFQKLPKDKIPQDYEVFMAVAETCGHDRRGKPIKSDEIRDIAPKYREWLKDQEIATREDENI